MAPGDSRIYEGIVIPEAWDDAGKATAISLYTDDEDVLAIRLDRGRGRDLLRLIRRRVRVVASLSDGGGLWVEAHLADAAQDH